MFGDIGQAGDGALLPPLAAQNGHYLRYLTAYNQIAYDHIVRNQWYLRSHLPEVPVPRPPLPPVQFPDGSIVVKSAWVEMTGFTKAQQKRFYTRTAIVRDPGTGRCSPQTVGLVGIHIVQKTPSRPQWIWSSFEQIDTVPPAEPGAPGRFTLNDGADGPMPALNPLALIPLAKQPVRPFNVVRAEKTSHSPENPSCQREIPQASRRHGLEQLPAGRHAVAARAGRSVGARFRHPGGRHLRDLPWRWRHLRLRQHVHGNLQSETRPAQGCMNSHNRARMTADFMWSVFEHAYPAKIALPEPQ